MGLPPIALWQKAIVDRERFWFYINMAILSLPMFLGILSRKSLINTNKLV